MPNWACGYVEATGKRAGLLAFADHFLDWDSEAKRTTKYFARSFLETDKEHVPTGAGLSGRVLSEL